MRWWSRDGGRSSGDVWLSAGSSPIADTLAGMHVTSHSLEQCSLFMLLGCLSVHTCTLCSEEGTPLLFCCSVRRGHCRVAPTSKAEAMRRNDQSPKLNLGMPKGRLIGCRWLYCAAFDMPKAPFTTEKDVVDSKWSGTTTGTVRCWP